MIAKIILVSVAIGAVGVGATGTAMGAIHYVVEKLRPRNF